MGTHGEDGGTTAAVEWPRRAGATVDGVRTAHTHRHDGRCPFGTTLSRRSPQEQNGSALRVPAGVVAPALMDGLALLHNVLQAPFLKGHRGDYRGDSRARFRRVLLVDLVVPVNDCMSLVGIMWECDM